MKNRLLFLIVFCISVSDIAVAQQPVEKLTHIGVSVIPQIGKVNAERNGNIDNKVALSFSIAGDFFIDLSAKWQLNTGLEWQHAVWNYTDQSGQWPSDVVNGEFVPGHGGNYFHLDFNQDYIGVPVLIRCKLGAEKSDHFFLQAGAKIRRLINTSGFYQLYEGHQPTIRHDIEGSVFFEPINTKIFGVIGFGFEKKLGNRKVYFNPTYEFSRSNIYEEIGSTAIANGKT